MARNEYLPIGHVVRAPARERKSVNLTPLQCCGAALFVAVFLFVAGTFWNSDSSAATMSLNDVAAAARGDKFELERSDPSVGTIEQEDGVALLRAARNAASSAELEKFEAFKIRTFWSAGQG